MQGRTKKLSIAPLSMKELVPRLARILKYPFRSQLTEKPLSGGKLPFFLQLGKGLVHYVYSFIGIGFSKDQWWE